MHDLSLSQLVAQPTHTKGNILDIILTNAEDRITDVAVLQSTFSSSDHFPVSFPSDLWFLILIPTLNHPFRF